MTFKEIKVTLNNCSKLQSQDVAKDRSILDEKLWDVEGTNDERIRLMSSQIQDPISICKINIDNMKNI